ncbi:MAG: glycosyltransferase family 2 protein [Ignavibacteria bacterium]
MIEKRKRQNFIPKLKKRVLPQTEKKQRKVSIVIPAYNEEDSLRPLAVELRKVFNEMKDYEFEIIIVDDGSNDNSLKVLNEIRREDDRFKIISFQKNYGKSAALSVGFKYATGDLIITMDADLQDDPQEIPNLIKKIHEGYDLVSGWKKIRFDPFIKKYSSRIFNFVTALLTGIKIHDFNCGLKIYRKEVAQSIKVYGEMHRYLPVLAHWNGFKVGEIIVRHHPRRYGKTKFGASRFLKGFLDLITILFTTRYLRRPLHFFGTIGFLLFLLGFGIDFYLAIEWAFYGQYLTNRPMLWLGILLILLGVQTIAIGLIGEMIAHHAQRVEDYHIKLIKL